MPVNRSVAATVALVLLGSIPLALAQTRFHKVDLNLDVTWAGKRGVGTPIRPGANQTLKGLCAITLTATCPQPEGAPFALPAAYSVTATGFRVMLLMGTALTFTRTP